VIRFLSLAVPVNLLTLALFHFAWEAAGFPLPFRLGGWFLLGLWALEALGLVLGYLLICGAGTKRWLAGLAAAWLAWVFRGPAVVLTVVGTLGAAREPWWTLAAGWLGVYTLCGFLMAWLGRRSGI
jgi:hypothetical protein